MRRTQLFPWAAALAAGLVLSVVAPPGTPAQRADAAPVADLDRPVTDPVAPRVAFTTDRAGLGGVPFRSDSDGVHVRDGRAATVPRVPAGSQAGGATGGAVGTAFVASTDEDPDGEVFVALPGGDPVQVTCGNDARESHPVVSPAGDVAYASDTAGSWDIWVTRLELVDEGVISPCSPDAPGAVRVTDHPGDDLWPAWAPLSRRIVFGSDRDDPLGDLYSVTAPQGPAAAPEQGLRRLTAHPAADSQPVVAAVPALQQEHLVFSSTRHRGDGSLVTAVLPGEGDVVVRPLWPDPADPTVPSVATPQSSEAAVSHDVRAIAYTTTDDDPYGDVRLTHVLALPGEPLTADPADARVVTATGGVTESHPAFGYGPVLRDADGTGRTDVLFTRRGSDADVHAVLAADGSKRSPLGGAARAGADDASPAYSPDGTRLVHAGAVQDGGVRGYALFVADADGDDHQRLEYDRERGDVDLDPTWSPDGTRIAFVRHEAVGEIHHSAAVWVVDVVTGDTRRLSPEPTFPATRWDTDPTWSPDGTRIAVSSAGAPPPPPVAAPPPPAPAPAADVAVALTADPPVTSDIGTVTVTARLTATGGTVPARLTLSVPGLRDVVAPAGCTVAGTVVTCAARTVSPGQVVVVEVSGAAAETGAHTAQATVVPDGPETDPSNNQATSRYEIHVFVHSRIPPFTEPGTPRQSTVGSRLPAFPGSTALVPSAAASRAAPSHAPGRGQVVVLDVGGGPEVRLSEPDRGCSAHDGCGGPLEGRAPAWSPDGLRIAVERDGAVHVATLRRNGSGGPAVPEVVASTTQVTGVRADGAPTPSRAQLSSTHDPAWSPDGTRLAVAGQPAGHPDDSGVYVLDADGGGLTALVQGPGAQTEPAFQPFADLAVQVTAAPSDVDLDRPATVRVTVTNHGPRPAAGVVLGLDVEGGVGVRRTGDPACETSGSAVRCSLPGPLLPGAATTVSVVTGGTRSGTATLSATASAATPDAAPADNTATTQVTVRPAPDLSVALSADPDQVEVDGTSTVTVVVANPGSGDASEVTATVVVPDGVQVTGAEGCEVDGDTVRCAVPDGLEAGAQVRYEVVSTGLVPGEHVLRAEVTSAATELVTVNNRDSLTLQVLEPAEQPADEPADEPADAPSDAPSGGTPDAPADAGPAPTLRVLPGVGAPGQAVLAYGEHFPPGAEVVLTWSTGVTADPRASRVADDGTLRRPVLVVKHDKVGDRTLTATSPTGAFEPVSTQVLVVPSNLAPPDFNGRG